jgi:hypothetical protein
MGLEYCSVTEMAGRASPLDGNSRENGLAHFQEAGVQVRHQLRLNGIGARLGDFLRRDRRATESKSSCYPQNPHVPPGLCWQQFYYGRSLAGFENQDPVLGDRQRRRLIGVEQDGLLLAKVVPVLPR